MKLIERVFGFAIYELDEEMTNKFGGKFVLSMAEFSKYWLENHSIEETILELKPFNYEGILQTRLEAYYQANLVEMEYKYNLLKNNVKEVYEKMNNRQEINWYKAD